METTDGTVVQRSGDLVGLPLELTEQIADYLSIEDFFSFRLTTRMLHVKSSELFIKRYFKRRVAKFQLDSLRDLVNIAKHPKLAKRVEVLEITPGIQDTYSRTVLEWLTQEQNRYFTEHHNEYTWGEHRYMKKSLQIFRSRFEEDHQRDELFRKSGLAIAFLTRAFMGFSGLQKLRYGIFETKSKYWDERMATCWKDAGLQKSTGIAFPDYRWDRKGAGWRYDKPSYLANVLSAVIASGITVSSLNLEAGAYHAVEIVELEAPEDLTLQNCFSQLKRLQFFLSTDYRWRAGSDSIVCLFRKMPQSIEDLELFTQHSDKDDKDSWQVEAAEDIWRVVLKESIFPRLQSLNLAIACASLAHCLCHFIGVHRNSLRTVRVSPCGVARRDKKINQVKWSPFLDLFLSAPNLDEVFLQTPCSIYNEVDNDTCHERLGLQAGRASVQEKMKVWQQVEDDLGLSENHDEEPSKKSILNWRFV